MNNLDAHIECKLEFQSLIRELKLKPKSLVITEITENRYIITDLQDGDLSIENGCCELKAMSTFLNKKHKKHTNPTKLLSSNLTIMSLNMCPEQWELNAVKLDFELGNIADQFTIEKILRHADSCPRCSEYLENKNLILSELDKIKEKEEK